MNNLKQAEELHKLIGTALAKMRSFEDAAKVADGFTFPTDVSKLSPEKRALVEVIAEEIPDLSARVAARVRSYGTEVQDGLEAVMG